MRNIDSAQSNRHNRSSNLSKNKATAMFKTLLTKLIPERMARVVKCESVLQDSVKAFPLATLKPSLMCVAAPLFVFLRKGDGLSVARA